MSVCENCSTFKCFSYLTMMPRMRQALVEFENVEDAISCVSTTQTNQVYIMDRPVFFNFSTSQEITRWRCSFVHKVVSSFTIYVLCDIVQVTVRHLPECWWWGRVHPSRYVRRQKSHPPLHDIQPDVPHHCGRLAGAHVTGCGFMSLNGPFDIFILFLFRMLSELSAHRTGLFNALWCSGRTDFKCSSSILIKL